MNTSPWLSSYSMIRANFYQINETERKGKVGGCFLRYQRAGKWQRSWSWKSGETERKRAWVWEVRPVVGIDTQRCTLPRGRGRGRSKGAAGQQPRSLRRTSGPGSPGTEDFLECGTFCFKIRSVLGKPRLSRSLSLLTEDIPLLGY